MGFSTEHITIGAIKKIERYCAYQERCRMDVIFKLREMGVPSYAIDEILAHLIENNYLNEERFAQIFTRGKFGIKKWGKDRIVNELRLRNISKDNIQNALKEIDEETYIKTLNELAHKRLAQLAEKNIQKRRRKLADYLLYRGWESDLVYAKLKELIPLNKQ